jgi:hypothetical protein
MPELLELLELLALLLVDPLVLELLALLLVEPLLELVRPLLEVLVRPLLEELVRPLLDPKPLDPKPLVRPLLPYRPELPEELVNPEELDEDVPPSSGPNSNVRPPHASKVETTMSEDVRTKRRISISTILQHPDYRAEESGHEDAAPQLEFKILEFQRSIASSFRLNAFLSSGFS